jgi:hypothetical protein
VPPEVFTSRCAAQVSTVRLGGVGQHRFIQMFLTMPQHAIGRLSAERELK